MVKLAGLLPPGALPVVLLGFALGFGGTLTFFPTKEEAESTHTSFAESFLLGKHEWVVRCLAFAPDGKTLATGGAFSDVPGEIRLWDMAAFTERAAFQGESRGTSAVEFSPDGRLLATVSSDHLVNLWDITTGRTIAWMPVPMPRSPGLALAPDGQTLAVAGLEGDPTGVRLWEVAGEEEHRPLGGSGPVRFSADGSRLAFWRFAADGETGGVNPEYFTGFAPTGASTELPTAQIWEIPLQRERLTLHGHAKFVWALAFSPDGKVLATAGFDETIRLWEVRTGRELATLRGHTDQIGALAFSPDGNLIASASHDETIRLWDPASGHEVQTLRGHTGTITCLAFAPDGQWIASGGHDKTVRLWRRTATQ